MPFLFAQLIVPYQEQEPRKLLLPQASRCAIHAVNYLHGRGIDYDLIDYCIQTGRIYESQPYHNVVFVGRDLKGQPRYAALRGTVGDFKGEAPGSGKRYSFTIAENPSAPGVHLFESAIDLLSYATLLKMNGRDWRQDALLSLGGVFKRKQEFVIPLALSQSSKTTPAPTRYISTWTMTRWAGTRRRASWRAWGTSTRCRTDRRPIARM